MIRRLLVAALVVAALLLTASSAGAVGWVTGPPVSPPNRFAVNPQVAVLTDGTRIVAWVQLSANGQAFESLDVRVAPPGGDFGPPQTFASPSFSMLLATGADGTAVLAWTQGNNNLHIARRAPGATTFVDRTASLPIPATDTTFITGLAVQDNGDTWVAESSQNGGGQSIWAWTEPAKSAAIFLVPGTNGPTKPIDQASTTGPAHRDVSGAGIATDGTHVTTLWGAFNNPGNNGNQSGSLIVGHYIPADPVGHFAPATIDSATGDSATFPPFFPSALAGGDSHTYVLWTRSGSGITGRGNVFFEDVANGGAMQTMPGPATFSQPLDVGVDNAGTLIAGLSDSPAGAAGEGVASLIVPNGATPPFPVQLTPLNVARELEGLAVAPDGGAVMLTDRPLGIGGNPSQIQARVRAPGGAFGPPEEVGGPHQPSLAFFSPPAVAAGSGGRALVAWPASDPSGVAGQRLFVSERDATPPTLQSITAPASAQVGDRVDLSATATDTQSPTTVSWDFGDGSHATGASVSHVFGTPGPTTVTVTATDGAANTTTQTRTITVTPAPVTPAPPPPPADTTPPTITRLSLTHSTFRVGGTTTARAANTHKTKAKKAPVGTTIRFTLSERALVVVETKVGTLTRFNVKAGPVSIGLSGRIGHSVLKPGRSTATITAIDGAGNRSRPARIAFKVVR